MGEIDECLYEGAVRAGSVKWDEVVSQKWTSVPLDLVRRSTAVNLIQTSRRNEGIDGPRLIPLSSS